MPEMVKRFKEDLADVQWQDLRTHVHRDTLITLSQDLDLIETATAVARDDSQRIQTWIAEGRLAKPSAAEITAWEKQLDKPFRMLIVQPFILVQAVCNA